MFTAITIGACAAAAVLLASFGFIDIDPSMLSSSGRSSRRGTVGVVRHQLLGKQGDPEVAQEVLAAGQRQAMILGVRWRGQNGSPVGPSALYVWSIRRRLRPC